MEPIAKEMPSMALLLLLYVLQGIPLGLTATVPMLIESKITMAEQAIFAFASWPFSLKLLWAPIVDGCFSQRIGRRKTWIIPTQLICGALMVYVALSGQLSRWVGEHGEIVSIFTLTAVFFGLYFLMATQDIAVDGWALTLLSKERQHLAGTLNSVGQTLGYFLSNVIFLVLSVPEYCNKLRIKFGYLENSDPILSLSNFFVLSGSAFLLTTFALFFVPERSNLHLMNKLKGRDGKHQITTESRKGKSTVTKTSSNAPSNSSNVMNHELDHLVEDEEEHHTLADVFRQAAKLLSNRNILTLTMCLFTHGMALSMQSSALRLKLIKSGIPVAEFATLSPLFIGVGILLPIFMAKLLDHTNQLKWLWRSSLFQIILVPLSALLPRLVYFDIKNNSSSTFAGISSETLLIVIFTILLATIQSTLSFCSLLSFFPAIADPLIGGTFITLLTTITNASSSFIRPLALYCLQLLDNYFGENCHSKASLSSHTEKNTCTTWVSGFEVAMIICGLLSLAWIIFVKDPLYKLQRLPTSAWWVRDKPVLKNEKGKSLAQSQVVPKEEHPTSRQRSQSRQKTSLVTQR